MSKGFFTSHLAKNKITSIEYRNLYRADVFSAQELDDIRCASLEGLD